MVRLQIITVFYLFGLLIASVQPAWAEGGASSQSLLALTSQRQTISVQLEQASSLLMLITQQNSSGAMARDAEITLRELELKIERLRIQLRALDAELAKMKRATHADLQSHF